MEKQRWEESNRRREEERSERRKSQKKEDAGAGKKVGKSRNTVFFQWFVHPENSGGSKVRLGGCGALGGDEI